MTFDKPDYLITMLCYGLIFSQTFFSCYYSPPSDDRISKPITPTALPAIRISPPVVLDETDLVPLTKKMVENYRLDLIDLRNVRVFLGKRLIIGETISEYDKSTDSTLGALTLSTQSHSQDIVFEKNLEGKILDASYKPEYMGAFRELNIEVSFEAIESPYAAFSLVFSPDLWNGNFDVEVSGILQDKIVYGGKKYRCKSGCIDNVLYIYASELKSHIANQPRVVKGRRHSVTK